MIKYKRFLLTTTTVYWGLRAQRLAERLGV